MKTLTLFIVSSLLFLIPTAEAQLVCPERGIEQVTDFDMSSSSPSINVDGTRIAFESDATTNGVNPEENRAIYLFDTTTRIFTQITDITTGTSRNASINADGTRIAFDSDANIIGPNPGGNQEIYLFDTVSGMFTQITDEPSGDSARPSINADGTRIAFRSNAEINGPNPGDNDEIYLFDTTTGIITQITDEPTGQSFSPSINADGTRVAFASEANINGPNPGDNFEVYLFDTVSGIFTQITDEPSGITRGVSISADGMRIAFESDANINGGNPNGISNIYLFDAQTGIITQITLGLLKSSIDESISADGRYVGFASSADINGTNPDGNTEIYIFDTVTGLFTQLTDTTSDFNNEPSLNSDGTRIAYENESFPSREEIVREIFLASCFDPSVSRPIPTLSEWGLIALAAAMGMFGVLYSVRRRTAV